MTSIEGALSDAIHSKEKEDKKAKETTPAPAPAEIEETEPAQTAEEVELSVS